LLRCWTSGQSNLRRFPVKLLWDLIPLFQHQEHDQHEIPINGPGTGRLDRSGRRQRAVDYRNGQHPLRAVSRNDTVPIERLLVVDERMVQLSTRQDDDRSCRASEEYRERQSLVPIPSARDRHVRSEKRDGPVRFGRIIMTRIICLASAILIGAAAMPVSAQVNLDMNQITCGDWLGYDPTSKEFVRFWLSGYYNASQNSNVLDMNRLQRNSAKVAAYCKKHKSQSLPTAIKNAAS